jgi:hypothetical protein
MMSKPLFLSTLCAAVTIVASGPLLAQGPDGAWLDRAGRYTMLQFGGSGPTSLKSGNRSVADYVTLFKEACLDRPFGADEPRSAIEARAWGFQRLDHSVPSGRVTADLSGWQAPDVSVRSSTGVFFAPNPQCNVTAALATPIGSEELEAAMTQALGAQPANVAKKVDKKGQRRRGYEPMWKLAGPTGLERTVYARVTAEQNGTRLHLGAMEPKGPNR